MDSTGIQEPYAVAQDEIHAKVREILQPFLSRNRGMKVLDAAAGNGYMTKYLLENGAEVTPIDISSSDWRLPNVKCKYSDFNKCIDARDNEFDLVVSIETIEHVENPFMFIRELGRVCGPKGTVIITTPNVHSLRSRVKYLFAGLPTLFEYVEDDGMGQHISPVSIGQFLYAFKMARLQLVEIYTTGPTTPRAMSLLFSLLNAVTHWGVMRLKAKRRRYSDFYTNVLSEKQLRELNRDISLIVVAQKQA